jgi:hypothetical protein
MLSDMESSVYGSGKEGSNDAKGSTLREKFGYLPGSGSKPGCTQVGEGKAQRRVLNGVR